VALVINAAAPAQLGGCVGAKIGVGSRRDIPGDVLGSAWRLRRRAKA